MNTQERKAMEQALEALEEWQEYMPGHWDKWDEEAITALRQCLEPKTRPATREEKIVNPGVYEVNVEPQTNDFNPDWMCTCGDLTALNVVHRKDAPCYYPDKREWVGLTDEEMDEAMDYWSDSSRSAYGGAHAADGEYVSMISTWRYIEAKLKEKNT